MTRHEAAVAIAALALASAANAATELHIDINSMTVQAVNGGGAAGPFTGLNHTGALVFGADVDTALAGVSVDGLAVPFTDGLSLAVNGQIDLLNGQVSGGFFEVLLSDGSAYSTQIMPGVGGVAIIAGGAFIIEGLTFNGFFSDLGSLNVFGGASVAPWALVEPLVGSFMNFAVTPGAGGFDPDSDLDIYVYRIPTIPLPGAAGLGLAGLAGLAACRRRRA